MRTILFFLLTIISLNCIAQQQNNNWCFGNNAGISFNTNPPSAFTSAVRNNEGVAAISHRISGGLLFYASTYELFNRNDKPMLNGSNIGADGIGTVAQGIYIVPFVNDTNKYYVFTLSGPFSPGRLAYSIVDISLDGGMGGVVPGQKHIVIDSNFTEAMTVVEGCRSYWLIVKKRHYGTIYAYKITANGINKSAVTTNITYPYTNKNVETIKVSPDRKRLIVASWNGEPTSFLALHDFNIVTGQAPNGRVLDLGGGGFYGCEFSPNSQVLYAGGWTGQTLYQYDLTLPTAAAIKSSRKTLYTSSNFMGMMQLAPDSNIYVSIAKNGGLDRISNPNLLFPNCTYTPNSIPFSGTSVCGMGLPQAVIYPIGYNPNYITKRDTLICFNKPKVLRGRPGQTSYEWQDGSSADSLIITKGDTYWVRSPDTCDFVTDTIVVHEVKLDAGIINTDTTICNGDTILLTATVFPSDASFKWSTGDTVLNTKAAENRKYRFNAEYTGCKVSDEINISHHINLFVELGDDKEICADEAITLPALVTSGSQDKFLWQDGSTDREYRVNKTGQYRVRVTSLCGSVSDTVNITTRNCHLYFPGVFSPNGDGLNDMAHLLGDITNVSKYELHIYHRWGQEVFTTNDIYNGWDGNHNGQPAAQATYYYYIKFNYFDENKLMKGSLHLIR